MKWVRLESWHIVSQLDVYKTICGRPVNDDGEFSESMPMAEKSCESCLRIQEEQREKTGGPARQ